MLIALSFKLQATMKYVFANWKMYLTVDESVALAKQVSRELLGDGPQVVLFPNTLALTLVRNVCVDTHIGVGAQDCYWTPRGAYTGAVSADILARAGVTHVLVGHSERRHVFGEGDTDVHKKFVAAIDAGLTPVLCIGETHDEKEEGKREYRLKKQLFTALGGVDLADKSFMVAYEPVWAITGSGSGESCLPADVDDIHGWIRQELRQYTSETVPVLYGGSVTPENVVSYVSLETVDGVLVGSASTHVGSLVSLVQVVKGVGASV